MNYPRIALQNDWHLWCADKRRTPGPDAPTRWMLAVIGITDTDNIILAEIASHLHLDHDHRFCCVIAKRMLRAKRDVDGMAGFKCHCFIAKTYFGCPADDHPMLGPLVVMLQ